MYRFLYNLYFILFAILFSCSKSNEAKLQGLTQGMTAPGCDTVNMTFSADIVPIMQAHCNSCHNTTTANAGVNMENYNGVKLIADNGTLVGTITHASGFSPMPQGKPKLAACDIDKIKAWIEQGTKNN